MFRFNIHTRSLFMGDRKEILTDCTLCYHSCGCRVTIEDGRAIGVEGLESHPINHGKLCLKGEACLDNIYSPERLKYPMKRTDSGFERISWDQALDEIASKLNHLKDRFGPQVLGVFSGSIGVENLEMAGLTQSFKAAFGSPNFFLGRKYLLPHAHSDQANDLRAISHRRTGF